MDETARVGKKHGLRRAKPKFDGLVLVCTKCLKRQALGRREVGRSLRRSYKREQIGRKLRVVETGCLGPCPKRMLALATPAALSRGHVLLIDPGLPTDALRDLLGAAATSRRPEATPYGPDRDA